MAWYGVWLFSDWMDLPLEGTDVEAVARVELEASVRDPYRQLSRVFHLLGTARGEPGSTAVHLLRATIRARWLRCGRSTGPGPPSRPRLAITPAW